MSQTPGDGRRVEVDVPDVPAASAGAPPGQPADDLVVVDHQLEHDVERGAELGEDLVEVLGLGDVAREAVEQEAAGGVVLGQPVADHARW